MAENPNQKYNSKQRRELMAERIKEKGWLNFNRSDFAREVGVSPVRVHNEYHRYMSSIPKLEIKEMKKGIYHNYEMSVKKLLKIIEEAENKSDKLKALELLSKIQADWTKFLEDYGLKEKEAEKLQVEGEINIIDLVKKWKKD